MATYKFKKVILHNFLSYGHSEIELNNKNYCLVKGINRCPLDNAVSNGSGKSSWISAICWALTGETINGNSSNIKNVYIDDNSCYVTLLFSVDSDDYEITRIKEPSPNLKILKNKIDISGKGIRESSLILAQHLPDLTRDLLTSVILIGQGMPNRFTDNTPSGRKEVLEKLSKSDFMIEDIKNKINNRITSLNNNIRVKEDKKLELNTQLKFFQAQLNELEKNKDSIINNEYTNDINYLNEQLNNINTLIKNINDKISSTEDLLVKANSELLLKSEQKQADLEKELSEYTLNRDCLVESKSELSSQIISLNEEIKRVKEIKDICPTCGQKIPGVVKKDTSSQEEFLKTLEKTLSETVTKLNSCNTSHIEYIAEINFQFKNKTENLNKEIVQYKKSIADLKEELGKTIINKNKIEEELLQIKIKKENQIKKLEEFNLDILKYKNKINDAMNELKEIEKDSTELISHLSVVKQMDTLVKRDFRGYLLSNLIDFINNQAKEYCNDVFGTRELEFKLNGNNIDIEYCGKDFSSLSGGEKQRIDIIIQFSIRKMMSQYLDFNSNILCLDEIFDNLDIKATNNVINLISNRLSDIESVFIISHHADSLEIPMDTELEIEKNENGISSIIFK